jgi:soluble lytic murein transglycosylase
MRSVSNKTALKIIYWNAVAAIFVVCLSAISMLHRVHRFDNLIIENGSRFHVDPRLISALIWRESRFDPNCVGTHQEVGLMQITETAAREWADTYDISQFTRNDLFNPSTNIQAGTWYLARAIRRWSDRSDPLPFALAEYNAGRSNAQRWAAKSGHSTKKFMEAITYPSTRKYITDILTRYRGRV